MIRLKRHLSFLMFSFVIIFSSIRSEASDLDVVTLMGSGGHPDHFSFSFSGIFLESAKYGSKGVVLFSFNLAYSSARGRVRIDLEGVTDVRVKRTQNFIDYVISTNHEELNRIFLGVTVGEKWNQVALGTPSERYTITLPDFTDSSVKRRIYQLSSTRRSLSCADLLFSQMKS